MDLASTPESGMERVAALFDLAAVPMMALSDALVVVGVNRAFRDRFGTMATAMVGQPMRQFLAGDEHASHEAVSFLADDMAENAVFLRHVVGPAGRRFAVRVATERVRSQGRTIGYAATILAADELDTADGPGPRIERRWRTVLDELPLAVLVLTSGVVRYANAAALDLLGCASVGEAALRVHSADHVRADERRRLERRLQELEAGDADRDPLTWHLVRPDGTERIVETRSLRVPFDDASADLIAFVDLTEQTHTLDALRRSEARLHGLVAQSPVGIFETDARGRYVYANERWCDITGTASVDVVGCGWLDPIHPGDREHVRAAANAAAATTTAMVTEMRILRPDGSVVHAHVEARPLPDAAGAIAGWLGTATDITPQVHLRMALSESEARFRDLADSSPDVVVRLRFEPFGLDYVSPSVAALTGTAPAEYVARPRLFLEQLHPDDAARVVALVRDGDGVEHVEFRLAHGDGTYHVVEARMHRHRIDGRLAGIDATLRDVTAAAHLREHLRDLSRRDPLTGLLNRRALIDALRERVARREPTALLFIDLDDFKAVNDTLGHEAGDEVLTAVAGRLSGGVRAGALISRFAGDEFVIALDPAAAAEVAERLRQAAAQPIVLRGGGRATVGMSVGLAELDPAAPEPVEDVLHRADDAMYRAKRSNRADDAPAAR